MTAKIRMIFCGLLLVCCLPLFPYYIAQDAENEREAALQEKRMEEKRADSLRLDAIRIDSLQLWLTKSKSASPAESLLDLKVALKFAVLDHEKSALDSQVRASTFRLSSQMIRTGQYRQGLATVQQYLSDHAVTPELWYSRAQCYVRLDSVKLAVDDLDSARNRGYHPAAKLYEVVNPLRRHIAYRITLCNDGSTSGATGRGVCSWHGGVAEWNHPVYETSRKY